MALYYFLCLPSVWSKHCVKEPLAPSSSSGQFSRAKDALGEASESGKGIVFKLIYGPFTDKHLTFKKNYFILFYVQGCFVCMCFCEPHACLVSTETKTEALDLRNRNYRWL